jgi:hypothetical protein
VRDWTQLPLRPPGRGDARVVPAEPDEYGPTSSGTQVPVGRLLLRPARPSRDPVVRDELVAGHLFPDANRGVLDNLDALTAPSTPHRGNAARTKPKGKVPASRDFENGSDGTRTRDLRRDSSVRQSSPWVSGGPKLGNKCSDRNCRVGVGQRSSV